MPLSAFTTHAYMVTVLCMNCAQHRLATQYEKEQFRHQCLGEPQFFFPETTNRYNREETKVSEEDPKQHAQLQLNKSWQLSSLTTIVAKLPLNKKKKKKKKKPFVGFMQHALDYSSQNVTASVSQGPDSRYAGRQDNDTVLSQSNLKIWLQ